VINIGGTLFEKNIKGIGEINIPRVKVWRDKYKIVMGTWVFWGTQVPHEQYEMLNVLFWFPPDSLLVREGFPSALILIKWYQSLVVSG